MPYYTCPESLVDKLINQYFETYGFVIMISDVDIFDNGEGTSHFVNHYNVEIYLSVAWQQLYLIIYTLKYIKTTQFILKCQNTEIRDIKNYLSPIYCSASA